MGFAFRAIFWMAVVAAFAPASVFSTDDVRAPDELTDLIAQGQRLQQVCADLPALCDLADEAGGLAAIAANESLSRVENWLEEREASAADAS
jgi:non-canonical (house-cleaning) NTP pyrophosphatase